MKRRWSSVAVATVLNLGLSPLAGCTSDVPVRPEAIPAAGTETVALKVEGMT